MRKQLAQLAEAWRSKAATIDTKFTQPNGEKPIALQSAVAAFENCAEDIEQLLIANPPPQPQPTAQPGKAPALCPSLSPT